MAQPTLRVFEIAPPASPYNLTDLTGGVINRESLAGYEGQDYNRLLFNMNTFMKNMCGSQLIPTLIGLTAADISLATWSGMRAVWDPTDCTAQNSHNNEESMAGINIASGAGKGLSFSPYAGRSIKTMYWIGMTFGGTYFVNASLSDDSAPSVSYELTAKESVSCWAVEFCSEADELDCTMTASLTRTAGSGSGFIGNHSVYIPIPIHPFVPRQYGNYLRYFGG